MKKNDVSVKTIENIPVKNNNEQEKIIPQKKSKKKLITIIVACILLIGLGVFIYFKFLKHSNKQIVFFRYQDRLFLKNAGSRRNTTYKDDINTSNLKEYNYQCKYDRCRAFSLEEQKTGFDDSIDGTWVLIYDSSEKEEWPNSVCINKKGEYVLYNVETKQKYYVPLDENVCVTDVLLDGDGNPKGVTTRTHGTTVAHRVIDVETGNCILDTDDVVYGTSEKYQRIVSVVNNGKKDLYMVSFQYNSNKLLYDNNINYINDIVSDKDFDPEGNVIKLYHDKNSKDYFKIFDLTGKLIYTSKTYDSLLTDNGYFIVTNGSKVSIIDYKEKHITDISDNGKKNNYTTSYNEYYGEDGIVSVMETKKSDNDGEDKNAILYRYIIKENRLEKKEIDFDGVNARVALSRYFSNGFTTYKIKNTTVYLDNELIDSKKTELKKKLENLSNDKITKKLFEAKQNIYLFTEYDYNLYDNRAYEDNIYSPISIPVNFRTSIETIVKRMAFNYYSDKSKKLENDYFTKLYNKYYKYQDDSYGHYYNEEYYQSGFFGYIMASYFTNENNWDNYSEDSIVRDVRSKINTDGKLDEYNKAIKKYIESYVIK